MHIICYMYVYIYIYIYIILYIGIGIGEAHSKVVRPELGEAPHGERLSNASTARALHGQHSMDS